MLRMMAQASLKTRPVFENEADQTAPSSGGEWINQLHDTWLTAFYSAEFHLTR